MIIRKDTKFKLATNILDIMAVREIRNECRKYFTNDTSYISVFKQLRWYFGFYRKACRSNIYRVYILYSSNSPVGYGALHFKDNQLFITEGVAPQYRGMRFGTTILRKLQRIAKKENFTLIAEILALNKCSINLHKKAGFKLVKGGIKRYAY